MERMTRRGQAPVKKELVEASMSAFVFWMGTIAIGYMLVANSGWSLPLFPHMLLLLLVFAVGSLLPRPRDTCTPVEVSRGLILPHGRAILAHPWKERSWKSGRLPFLAHTYRPGA